MVDKGAEMYYNQAMSLLGQGEVKKALEYFERTVTIDGGYSPAWNNMGIALLDQGEYKKALSCFEQVSVLNPSDSMALYNKGYVLLLLERYEESVHTMNVFLEKYPKKDDFFKYGMFLKAKGLYGLKEYQQAKELLENCLKIDKKFTEAQELLNLVLKDIK